MEKLEVLITRCIVQFGRIQRYGKKPGIFHWANMPQYLVVKVQLTEWYIFINFLS
jgi:hypothetical protein